MTATAVEQLLKGEGLFSCDRFHVRMLKLRCVERQRAAQDGTPRHRWTNDEVTPDLAACRECPQGERLLAEGVDLGAGTEGRIGEGENRPALERPDRSGSGGSGESNHQQERSEAMEEIGTVIVKPKKVCKACGIEKALEWEFPKSPNTKDGYEGRCKQCKKEGRLIPKKKKTGDRRQETGGKKDQGSGPKKRAALKRVDKCEPLPSAPALTVLDALYFMPELCVQAEKNVAKWGLQDIETLGLAAAEECGEMCAAILDTRLTRKGLQTNPVDLDPVYREAVHLGALCVQVMKRVRLDQKAMS